MSNGDVGPLHLCPKPLEGVMEHIIPPALEVETQTTKEQCPQASEVSCKTGTVWLSSGKGLLQVWESHGTTLQ